MQIINRLLPPMVASISILTQSAFSFSYQQSNTLPNLSPNDDRDVYAMSSWASQMGIQQAEGVHLTSYDGTDYFAATQSDIAAGSCVLYTPSDLVITSTKSAQEFGESLSICENKLAAAGLQDEVPLFRVFFKLIAEYEKSSASPWFPWLDSLPRTFQNGASMTYDCFDCLPPYAAYCAMAERTNLVNFKKAVRPLGGPSAAPFDPAILDDACVLKWAYNVAVTRSVEANGERFLAPMIDMLNHGAAPEVEVSYDGATGDCYAYSSVDIPAGSPLRISYVGDVTDTTPLFATYGFLDDSPPGTFCKLMWLNEIEELGYGFSNLLFYQNGDISPEVYDVVLYHVLTKNDPTLAQEYCQAVRNGDGTTKNQYQEQYWQYIVDELRSHVDGLLVDLDKWSALANSYDLNTHPRVPMILQHNAFVMTTFLAVKVNLDNM